MSVKVIPEKIHLIGFRILHAQMESPLEFELESIISYIHTSDFDLAFKLEENMVKADFGVTIKTVSQPDSNELEASANFEFVYIFLIENLKDLAVMLEDNRLDIRGGLANSLASIVYSTSRGILMTRFQGTALADFILPVIDPNKLLDGRELK